MDKLHFSFSSNAEYMFDLDYRDLIENAYEYREEWGKNMSSAFKDTLINSNVNFIS